MFKIDTNTKQINITRGDIGTINISAKNEDGSDYTFQVGDILRLGVFQAKDYSKIVLEKDVEVNEITTNVELDLETEDTAIGNIVNKPVSYWYEIQLNPDTEPQTIIGHDEKGAKIFMLYPEGVKEE